MQKPLLLFFILISLSRISCGGGGTKHPPIPETTLVNIYADRMVLQEEGKLAQSDSAALNHRVDSLYHRYEVSRNDVEQSLAAYQQDIRQWKQFHDRVLQRLQQIQQSETHPPLL